MRDSAVCLPGNEGPIRPAEPTHRAFFASLAILCLPGTGCWGCACRSCLHGDVVPSHTLLLIGFLSRSWSPYDWPITMLLCLHLFSLYDVVSIDIDFARFHAIPCYFCRHQICDPSMRDGARLPCMSGAEPQYPVAPVEPIDGRLY